jgi:hypothetical protein
VVAIFPFFNLLGLGRGSINPISISLRRWELVSYHPHIVCLGVRTTYDVRRMASGVRPPINGLPSTISFNYASGETRIVGDFEWKKKVAVAILLAIRLSK